jgi:serine/threonine protein kinase
MLLLHHPFIASLKEMVILDPYYYLFMEYVNGGQLLDYIISHGKLREKQARRFARQIASALGNRSINHTTHTFLITIIMKKRLLS